MIIDFVKSQISELKIILILTELRVSYVYIIYIPVYHSRCAVDL